ncbi:PilZ domain-containing protein [Candidatus Omnitrophota bacterium]
MKRGFSFLSDERAVAEIRKHQWIESQKAKREIGFATAAVEWVKSFGKAWKRIHINEKKDYNFLLERRRFRRFRIDSNVELKKGEARVRAQAKELSFTGVLCQTSEYLPVNREVTINFNLQHYNHDRLSNITCTGMVNRVEVARPKGYEVFLRFDEAGQRYMEDSLLVSS